MKGNELWKPWFLVLGGFVLVVTLGGVYYQTLQAKPEGNSGVTPNLYDEVQPILERFYRRYDCGYNLHLYSDWKIEERGTMATAVERGTDGALVACAEEIPGIPLVPERIEDITIDGVAAKLYHDASMKDGTPEDDIRVHHPTLKYDISIRGTPGFVAQVGKELTWRR